MVLPSYFSKELLEELLAAGYAVEQKIDGVLYIRMTSLYYDELGDYISMHPKELCIEYWDRLVDSTKGYSILDFIREMCYTHKTIKELTKDKVDFCDTIGEELNGC